MDSGLTRTPSQTGDIDSVLSTSTTVATQPPGDSPFNPLGILSSASPSQHPSKFHPPKALAVRLWSIYTENVELFAGLKLLHLPTDEVRVYSAIDDPSRASFSDLALCYAIYFASTVTVHDDEVPLILGRDKEGLLLELKIGLEQALAHGNFLDRPSLTGLQALAIWLVSS
jgi:hypothetical protein